MSLEHQQQIQLLMAEKNLALVADSNSETFVRLMPVLKQLGLEAVSARDGVDALRLIDREAPLLVVAEAGLDLLDGFKLCSRLRQEESTRAIPIVLIGSVEDRQSRLAALQAGADDFFGKPLDMEDVRLRLSALLRRVRLASVDNGKIPRPARGLESAASHSDQARQIYARLLSFVEGVLAEVQGGEPVRLGGLGEAASSLVGEMARSSEIAALALGKRAATDLAAHHVNVSIFGLATARELELPEERLRSFAALGLVHDLGMARIPPSIIYSAKRLSREEFRIVADHPRHTYEILKAAGPDYEALAEIAYQEHEREKGQGYPRGLRGDQIHEFAKILGVADVYEACTHPRTYQKTFIPYEALQQLIEMRGEYFHPRYIKALMNALTVYPVGSFVQLNTGELGKVRATNGKNLMRPVVEILWNARGEPFHPSKVVDLVESPFLFVSKPLYEDQLPKA